MEISKLCWRAAALAVGALALVAGPAAVRADAEPAPLALGRLLDGLGLGELPIPLLADEAPLPGDLGALSSPLDLLSIPQATATDGHADAGFSPVPELLELSRATRDQSSGEGHWTAVSVAGAELYGLDMVGFAGESQATGALAPLQPGLDALNLLLCPASARGPALADGALVCAKVLDIERPEPYPGRDQEVEGGLASVRVAVTEWTRLLGFFPETIDQRFHLLYAGASSQYCSSAQAAPARNDYIYGFPTQELSTHLSPQSARAHWCPSSP